MGTPSVFISYTRRDEETALALDQWLRDKGIRVIIDRRDFIPGNDIEAEIVRCIRDSGKVVCIYSANSASRPYPELERRITAELERSTARVDSRRRLIYFCIDGHELPLEAQPRLAILAQGKSFAEACEVLLASILEEAIPPEKIDLSIYDAVPPWEEGHSLQRQMKEGVEVIGDFARKGSATTEIDNLVSQIAFELDALLGKNIESASEELDFLTDEWREQAQSVVLRHEKRLQEAEQDDEEEAPDEEGGSRVSQLALKALLSIGFRKNIEAAREFQRKVDRLNSRFERHKRRSLWTTTHDMVASLKGIIRSAYDKGQEGDAG